MIFILSACVEYREPVQEDTAPGPFEARPGQYEFQGAPFTGDCAFDAGYYPSLDDTFSLAVKPADGGVRVDSHLCPGEATAFLCTDTQTDDGDPDAVLTMTVEGDGAYTGRERVALTDTVTFTCDGAACDALYAEWGGTMPCSVSVSIEGRRTGPIER